MSLSLNTPLTSTTERSEQVLTGSTSRPSSGEGSLLQEQTRLTSPTVGRMMHRNVLCPWVPCRQGGTEAPCARFGHTATVVGDRMILIGGRDNQFYNDVWSYITATRTWTKELSHTIDSGAPRPPCRAHGSGVAQQPYAHCRLWGMRRPTHVHCRRVVP